MMALSDKKALREISLYPGKKRQRQLQLLARIELPFSRNAVLAFTLAIAFLFGTVCAQRANAQASLYPAIAEMLIKDGYAGRKDAVIAAIAKESAESNRRGFLAYGKKDYAAAEKLFREALGQDKTNSLAAYNLACVLSLSRGKKEMKEIAQLLWTAARADTHWAYKIFLDTDLDPMRGKTFSFRRKVFCPGDCGPDQWYVFGVDGTLWYGAGDTDLSGLAESTPSCSADGWYSRIGDYVFAFVPGRNAILWNWAAYRSAEYEGVSITEGPDVNPLLVFLVKRGAGNAIEDVSDQVDL
jgi:hypothetical protein